MLRRVLGFTILSAVLLPSSAFAQFGGGGGGMRPGNPGSGPQPGTPGGGGPGGEQKEEGAAEAAPENPAENPALQPLPEWPQQREKALQFFQLNGYLRFRAYLFHNFNMGNYANPLEGTATGSGTAQRPPFYIPYSEIGSTGQKTPTVGSNPISSCAARDGANCRTDNLTSADMRLRLEPTINVTSQVRVKAQIDLFDNLVMGSTPDGYYTNGAASTGAISALANSQASPTAGSNSVFNSIRAKRAWAEVRTPFGELRFGRMPNHWGLGMLYNNGDCLDCDYGQTVDRVMFHTKLWQHFFAFMWDWVATGPTTQIVGPQTGQGVFYNADTIDDVSQWSIAAGRMDSAEQLKEKIDEGKVVFNYGTYLTYRQQDWSESTNPTMVTNNKATDLQASLSPRHARIFVPDVWLRLNWKKLHIEMEAAMFIGNIGNLSDVYKNPQYTRGSTQILSGAVALKADYKLLHDALKIYFDFGFASGDDSDSVDPVTGFDNGVLNNQYANRPPFGNAIHRFTFDPDYHVDLIMFRRILGAVSNATYFKPGVSYDIIDNFGARVDLIYGLANRPVGYPGNSYNLGLEIDAALTYKNEEEGFYASLVYGVLFGFDALSQPASIYGPANKHDSDIAQTFQGRLAVKF